jgi:hypothetical protein
VGNFAFLFYGMLVWATDSKVMAASGQIVDNVETLLSKCHSIPPMTSRIVVIPVVRGKRNDPSMTLKIREDSFLNDPIGDSFNVVQTYPKDIIGGLKSGYYDLYKSKWRISFADPVLAQPIVEYTGDGAGTVDIVFGKRSEILVSMKAGIDMGNPTVWLNQPKWPIKPGESCSVISVVIYPRR